MQFDHKLHNMVYDRFTVPFKEKMSKQKLVFLIESDDYHPGPASTIGNYYMNRFTIDEDAGHEIVKICEFGEKKRPTDPFQTAEEKKQMGMGHLIFLEFVR